MGSFGEGFAAGGADDVADAGELGGENPVAEAGDAIVAPARVVGEAGFFDELVADHAVDGAVEGAGAELDGSSGGFGGLFHDGVAVFFSAGEGEENGEDCGGEGLVGSWCGSAGVAHARQYISVADVSAMDILRGADGGDGPGLKPQCFALVFRRAEALR